MWSNFKESKEVFLVFPFFSDNDVLYVYASSIIRIMMHNFIESMKLTTYANIIWKKKGD